VTIDAGSPVYPEQRRLVEMMGSGGGDLDTVWHFGSPN
jgi:hypothetical protein